MGKEEGIKGEYYFASLLNHKGVPFEYVDGYYDYKVNNILVEVKTCRISVIVRKNIRQVGRFDLKNRDNHKKLVENDGWYFFAVRMGELFLPVGLVHSKKVMLHKFSVHTVIELKPLSLDSWIKKCFGE